MSPLVLDYQYVLRKRPKVCEKSKEAGLSTTNLHKIHQRMCRTVLMSEFLLNEIGKRPTNEQNINDRESYALCCGVALGMVNLGLRNKQKTSKNGTVDDLSDLRIEERLLRYIVGGLDENYIYQQKGLFHPNASSTNNESERCSRIYEGDMINIDITAPGATLALGMIYLQSGYVLVLNFVSFECQY